MRALRAFAHRVKFAARVFFFLVKEWPEEEVYLLSQKMDRE